MADAELHIGIVGYGKIARDQHEPAIAATPGMRLEAVVDPTARHDRVPCFTTISELFAAGPRVDAVALCQPPRFRAEAVTAALAAGRHVFCEKPPGLDPAEVVRWAREARARGLTLFTAWHSREGAAVEAARARLAGTTIRAVTITWKEDVRRWHPGQAWIWEKDGFGVFDPGINALSILTALVPGPITVRSAALDRPANCAAPIAARIAMDAGGLPITADFDFRQTGPQTWDIAFETDAGRLVLGHGGNTLAVNGEPVACEAEREYPRLYARFRELALQGRCDADAAPLQLVCDAQAVASETVVAPFHA